MYLGLHVKCSILTKFVIYWKIFIEVSNTKLSVNPCSMYHADICRQMDGLTAWHHFSKREHFYGALMSLATMKYT
jgi:hypothetical protein